MSTDEKINWGLTGFCVAATVATVTWIAVGGGRDPEPSVTPSVSVPATRVTSPTPSAPAGVQEWPDCGYTLPTCVRLEGEQWYVIRDYQGDKRPVTLVSSVVRGDIVYRTVKG